MPSEWVTGQALIPLDSTKYDVSIRLENDSLTTAYIYFVLNGKILARFSINIMIYCSRQDCQVDLFFEAYNKTQVTLLFTDHTTALIFESQVSICSRIAKSFDDSYRAENEAFLKKVGQHYTFFEHPTKLSCLYPILQYKLAKDTWLRSIESTNRAYLSEVYGFEISFLTWNVAQTYPENIDENYIKFAFETNTPVIALVLQEVEYSVQSLVGGDSPSAERWRELFKKAIEPIKYKIITEAALGGVQAFLFAREGVNIEVISQNLIRLGVGNALANKSAILTRFKVEGVTVSWVGAHFDPHMEELQGRIDQIHLINDILKKQITDYTFISGDLNFRIDLPYDECIKIINDGDFEKLYEKDQLLDSMEKDPIVGRFKEPKITFKPTYKYDHDSDVFDTSKKHRVPAWTDRVLFAKSIPRTDLSATDNIVLETDIIRHMNIPGIEFPGESHFGIANPVPDFPADPECIEYRSFPDIRYSDHRPVLAVYKIGALRERADRRRALTELTMQRLDELEELAIPKCSIVPNHLELYPERKTVATVTNVSLNIAEFAIEYCPPYITVEPEKGFIDPGESLIISVSTSEPFEDIQIVSIGVVKGSPIVFEFQYSGPTVKHNAE